MSTTPTQSKSPVASPSVKPVASKKRRRDREGVSSDEERWLDALESGKLEEMDDELKKIKPKDPKLMTARQRAIYERGTEKEPPTNDQLLALPSGYKEKVMTAEAIQKAALKSQKRKQQADEKREKDKKKTMERILKKQETKSSKNTAFRPNRNVTPLVSYCIKKNQTTLAFHKDFPVDLARKLSKAPPLPLYCEMNCGNRKKYACSRTGVALCSLRCFRKNISSVIL